MRPMRSLSEEDFRQSDRTGMKTEELLTYPLKYRNVFCATDRGGCSGGSQCQRLYRPFESRSGLVQPGKPVQADFGAERPEPFRIRFPLREVGGSSWNLDCGGGSTITQSPWGSVAISRFGYIPQRQSPVHLLSLLDCRWCAA